MDQEREPIREPSNADASHITVQEVRDESTKGFPPINAKVTQERNEAPVS